MNRKISQVIQVSCVQMHWAKDLEFNLTTTLKYIQAAAEYGSRVVLFPEANLTSYYFPYLIKLSPAKIQDALQQVQAAAAKNNIWVIVGTIQKTSNKFLNLMHVINPHGEIVHEYAKVNTGRDVTKRNIVAEAISFRCLRLMASFARW